MNGFALELVDCDTEPASCTPTGGDAPAEGGGQNSANEGNRAATVPGSGEEQEDARQRGVVAFAAPDRITNAFVAEREAEGIVLLDGGGSLPGLADGTQLRWSFSAALDYADEIAALMDVVERRFDADDPPNRTIAFLTDGDDPGRLARQIAAAEAQSRDLELRPIVLSDSAAAEQELRVIFERLLEEDVAQAVLWFGPEQAGASVRAADRSGYPTDRLIGNSWAVERISLADLGEDAAGYSLLGFHRIGMSGDRPADADPALYDDPLFMKGYAAGVLAAEAMGQAQERYGRRAIDRRQMRASLEAMRLTAGPLRTLGLGGSIAPIAFDCADHAGGDRRFLLWRWTGERFQIGGRSRFERSAAAARLSTGNAEAIRSLAEAAAGNSGRPFEPPACAGGGPAETAAASRSPAAEPAGEDASPPNDGDDAPDADG